MIPTISAETDKLDSEATLPALRGLGRLAGQRPTNRHRRPRTETVGVHPFRIGPGHFVFGRLFSARFRGQFCSGTQGSERSC